MASEIEQPFRLSFQSDSINSGSISFGRFETESLCWERWSSFSHNRYLEEVEKYSRPGSVTEKKAYFEAHFKRRALLSQCSSDCQTGTEYQTSENDISENTGYSEELEQTSESSVQFDKSVNGEETEVTNHERLDMGTSDVGTEFKPATDTCSRNLCSTSENVPETQSSSIIDGEPRKEDCKYEAARVNLTHKSLDSFANSGTTTEDATVNTIEDDTATLEPQQESSLQVEIKLESKPMGSKSKSLVNISASRKASSGRELPNNPVGKHTKTRIEGLRTTVNTKMLSQKAASLPKTAHRTLKPEESKRSKLNDKRSGKDLKDEKGVRSKPAAVQEVVPETRQTTNRALPSGIPSRPGMRNNSIVSNSESNKLPERRKEEKKEDGVKQHPKSPNLKATPRPSFSSSEALVSAPGKNKVEPSRVKRQSSQTVFNAKPATSGSRRQASAIPTTSARNITGVSTHSPITNGGHPNQGEACGDVKCGKEKAMGSGGSLQKHRLTENIQVKKAPNNEGKPRQVIIKGRYVAGVSKTGCSAAVVIVS